MHYYYLEDNHPKYQYGVYKRVGNAIPYIDEIRYIDNMEGVKRYIAEIEKRHNHYRQIFYIDNNFYNNVYSINQLGTYYKFFRRKVADWVDIDILERDDYEEYDNVIYLKDFLKNI